MSPVTSCKWRVCTHWNSFDLFALYFTLYLPLPLRLLIMRFFSPHQALFGVFLGGDVFVSSAMATKVKVTKSMLNTLDYQNRGRRQCSQHKIAFICSLIVGISESVPGPAVDLLSRWVWPLSWLNTSLSCVETGSTAAWTGDSGHKHTDKRGQVDILRFSVGRSPERVRTRMKVALYVK